MYRPRRCSSKELAAIAGVDAAEYGLAMLKAGADLGDKTAAELISLDAKEFTMGASKVEIAQVNAVDVNDVIERKTEIEEVIAATIQAKELDLFLLVVTDILNSDSTAIALGAEVSKVEQAYGVPLVNNMALLKGVVSRKNKLFQY